MNSGPADPGPFGPGPGSAAGPSPIRGFVAPGYEAVRDAFAENFTARGELGAGVAVLAHGEPVVSLWAGWADEARTRPWQPDTLVHVWSTTKAMTPSRASGSRA